jgi:hypothetical protein
MLPWILALDRFRLCLARFVQVAGSWSWALAPCWSPRPWILRTRLNRTCRTRPLGPLWGGRLSSLAIALVRTGMYSAGASAPVGVGLSVDGYRAPVRGQGTLPPYGGIWSRCEAFPSQLTPDMERPRHRDARGDGAVVVRWCSEAAQDTPCRDRGCLVTSDDVDHRCRL